MAECGFNMSAEAAEAVTNIITGKTVILRGNLVIYILF